MTENTPVTFVLRLQVVFKPTLGLLALSVLLAGVMRLTDRVLQYLAAAEWKEVDPWYRDDIRIAWLVTLEASRGNPQALTDVTYRILGVHPNDVFTRITARRKAMLGARYADFFPEASSPKKPPVSVGKTGKPKNARAKGTSASGY